MIAGLVLLGVVAAGTPSPGTPVCVAPGVQRDVRMCADGGHGAVLAWIDERGGTPVVYASRVLQNAAVSPGWPAQGVRVGPLTGYSEQVRVAADGLGGAFLLFQHRAQVFGDTELRLAHLTGAGTTAPGWPDSGIVLTASCAFESRAAWLESDGAGGVYATWSERTDHGLDVALQRVQGDGTPASGWPADRVMVATRAGSGGIDNDEYSPTVVVDSSGAPWVFYRHAFLPDPGNRVYEFDLRAVRRTPSGNLSPGWSEDGVRVDVILEAPAPQSNPFALAFAEPFAVPASGGMDVSWGRPYGPLQMGCCDHATRRISETDGSVALPSATLDYNSAGSRLVRGNHGVLFVVADGPVFNLSSSPGAHSLATTTGNVGSCFGDGAGGFLALLPTPSDLRIQHVDSTLATTLGSDGLTIVNGTGTIGDVFGVSDDAGGSVVAWTDTRDGDPDLYAAAVPGTAAPVVPGARAPMSTRVSSRSAGALEYDVSLPSRGEATLRVFDVTGREVARAAIPEGSRRVRLDVAPPPGIYFSTVNQGGVRATTRWILLP